MATETSNIDLGRVLAETPDGVICVSAGGEVAYANTAAEALLGYPSGGLVGERVERVLDIEAWLPAAVAPGFNGASAVPVTAYSADGSLRPVELSIASHAARGEAPYYLSLVVRLVPERDRASGAVLLAAEREAFLAVVAHQLRSPIQPILVSLRTIERALAARAPLPEDTLPRALRQATRLGRLVDAILRDAAAPNGATVPVCAVRFDLGVFVAAIVDDYRMAFPARVFRYEAPAEAITIVSDRDRVDEIVVALIDNALRYSPRERPILVETRRTASGPSVRVIDQGIGVAPAERERIFAKYFRGSNVNGMTAGLGMGLYIARNLATRLRGALTVDSACGRGSAFTLTLPWSFVETPTLAMTPGGGAHGQASER